MIEQVYCVRAISFDAGHRIIGHESKCKMLHGHTYTAEFYFTGELDPLGRVIDFGEIKNIIGSWIDDNLDHNMILCKDDVHIINMIQNILQQRIYIMPYNPTAENIAYHLLHDICKKLFSQHQVKCTKIRLWETEKCSAEVSL